MSRFHKLNQRPKRELRNPTYVHRGTFTRDVGHRQNILLDPFLLATVGMAMGGEQEYAHKKKHAHPVGYAVAAGLGGLAMLGFAVYNGFVKIDLDGSHGGSGDGIFDENGKVIEAVWGDDGCVTARDSPDDPRYGLCELHADATDYAKAGERNSNGCHMVSVVITSKERSGLLTDMEQGKQYIKFRGHSIDGTTQTLYDVKDAEGDPEVSPKEKMEVRWDSEYKGKGLYDIIKVDEVLELSQERKIFNSNFDPNKCVKPRT